MSIEETLPEATDDDSRFVTTLRRAIDGLSENATTRRVYGDPIKAEGKTIIPVARVAYGFGGGFGSGPETDEADEESNGEGAGGGGGAKATPLGVFEITESETQFVRVGGWKRLLLAVGAGLGLGFLLGRK